VKFDERFLDEIKSRLRLSDVIGRTVKLRRQGREYVGLSPFNKEKSPSFFVNDDKGFFHDFSSGKHGDLIGFLQETERLSFREAVERLAAEAGLALPAEDPRAAEVEHKRQGLLDWTELAAKWFEAQLKRPAGEAARDYLKRRNLPEDQWAPFRLGFAPSGRTGLKDYLISKGAHPSELVDAGLLIAPEDGGAPYDRFRDRIIFPISDGRGRVVSFGGRAMDPAARAKYLNGPETSLFHKSALLYGLHGARPLLHANERNGAADAPLVVVEGYMDVIACQRAEIAAVAAMGTALTEEQMAVLWRLHPEPTLCFDGDGAGQRAAWRSIERALPILKPGRSFKFALVTGGKDPDEVLREQGAGALKAQLAVTRPFVEALFEGEKEAASPLDTPERRTAFKAALRKAAAAIADRDLSEAYRQDLLDRFRLETAPSQSDVRYAADTLSRHRWAKDAGRRLGKQGISAGGPSPEGRAAAKRLTVAFRPVAAAVAEAVVRDPELIDAHFETIEAQGFGDPLLENFAQGVIRLRLTYPTLDSRDFGRHLASSGFADMLSGIARAATEARALFLQPDIPAERARALWSHAFESLIRKAALDRAISDAKSDLEPDVRVVKQLKTERDAIDREIKSGDILREYAELPPNDVWGMLH
jgi:DNA primase